MADKKISELTAPTVGITPLTDVVPVVHAGTTYKITLSDLVASSGSGTVTTLSVATANGFAGTVATATTTPVILSSSASSSCPVVHSMMLKRGGPNDPKDVMRLQAFLRASEHADVDISGEFDAKTEVAVMVFQKKYKETLTPWDATKASGVVFITTIKKINQVVCGQSLTLNKDELATINTYKAKLASGVMTSVAVMSPVEKATSSGDMTSSPVETDVAHPAPVGPTVVPKIESDATMTAAAAQSVDGSMIRRLGWFLKNLF